MEWEKALARHAGSDGGWKDDFPLDHDLPEEITLDCSRLEPPIYPLFVVRIRTFLEWHCSRDRALRLKRPTDGAARKMFDALRVTEGLPVDVDGSPARAPSDDDVVLSVAALREFAGVEDVALKTREILEYQMTDISALGHASYMAVSELCGNAIEHGANPLGAYVAAARFHEPRRQVSIAIGDLGVGIPEHLRQRYPEWFDDGFAIAQALDRRVSGTRDPHRGNGFSEAFEAALSSALHAARIDIHSANGFVRTQFYGGEKKLESFPAPRFRRGTWISYDLVSA